jgi:hypothetical protein
MNAHPEHWHCPLECEHPQPIRQTCGLRLCGRCLFIEDRWTVMILCTPETCDEARIEAA